MQEEGERKKRFRMEKQAWDGKAGIRGKASRGRPCVTQLGSMNSANHVTCTVKTISRGRRIQGPSSHGRVMRNCKSTSSAPLPSPRGVRWCPTSVAAHGAGSCGNAWTGRGVSTRRSAIVLDGCLEPTRALSSGRGEEGKVNDGYAGVGWQGRDMREGA